MPFQKSKSDISQKQNEIANRYWGLSEFKTVEEMKLIFHITEDIWKKGLSFLVPSRDVMIEQTVDYINSNDNEKALFSLKQAIAVNFGYAGAEICQSGCSRSLGPDE